MQAGSRGNISGDPTSRCWWGLSSGCRFPVGKIFLPGIDRDIAAAMIRAVHIIYIIYIYIKILYVCRVSWTVPSARRVCWPWLSSTNLCRFFALPGDGGIEYDDDRNLCSCLKKNRF